MQYYHRVRRNFFSGGDGFQRQTETKTDAPGLARNASQVLSGIRQKRQKAKPGGGGQFYPVSLFVFPSPPTLQILPAPSPDRRRGYPHGTALCKRVPAVPFGRGEVAPGNRLRCKEYHQSLAISFINSIMSAGIFFLPGFAFPVKRIEFHFHIFLSRLQQGEKHAMFSALSIKIISGGGYFLN